jgi:cysteine desulfuration protein SufE
MSLYGKFFKRGLLVHLNYEKKQAEIKDLFAYCKTPEETYKKIIELGKKQSCFPMEERINENLVPGCQSIMYLHAFFDGRLMHFQAESEALISNGLAALLIKVYDQEYPETVLQCPPNFIEELNITASLSPGRSNGLSSLYLKMKQKALKALVSN